MRFNLKGTLLVSIAIATGFIVLLGYFVPALLNLQVAFLRWAVTLFAVALLVGVINLFRTHWGKIKNPSTRAVYSVVLMIFMVVTILVAGYFGPTSKAGIWILKYVQVPVEGSLMAILSVILAYSSIRLLRRRIDIFSITFLGVFLLVLGGTVAVPGLEILGIRDLKDWVSQVWASAGARGIILGVALGTVATGLRVLVGSDRPYGG